MVIETTDEKIRKNQFKWIADNGTLIIRQQGASNSSATLYTIATGKVFYVISASLSWLNVGNTTQSSVNLQMANWSVMELEGSQTDTDHGELSMAFPVPIKLTADQTIVLTSNTSGLKADASIVGYLFDA